MVKEINKMKIDNWEMRETAGTEYYDISFTLNEKQVYMTKTIGWDENLGITDENIEISDDSDELTDKERLYIEENMEKIISEYEK